MEKGKSGEINVFLVIAGLFVASIASISTLLFINKKQTVKTKASFDITYKCRTDNSVVWECRRDKITAAPEAKNAFCGVYSSLITEQGNNYTAVINKWKEEHERNKGYAVGECGREGNNSSPTPSTPQGGGREVSNGCFSLLAEFEVRNEGEKKAFYSWVTFTSDRGGDIKLEYNGIHVAGWNRFAGGSFTYSPQWTQPHTHDWDAGIAALNQGQTMSFSYRGFHSGCSPQDITLNCSIGYNNDGSTYVSGGGCLCRNCQTFPSPASPSPISPSNFQPTASPRIPSNYLTPTSRLEECYFDNYKTCQTVCINISNNISNINCIKCDNNKYKCVILTPRPTNTPILTNIPTPTNTPTPTLIPTQISTPIPTKVCTNYGIAPPMTNLPCPYEYLEGCKVWYADTQIAGDRYVKRNCGESNDSCIFKCKTIGDLISTGNNYSGNCEDDNTCLNSITAGNKTISAIVKVNNVKVCNKWLDAMGIIYGEKNVSTRFRCNIFGYNCSRINYDTQKTFSITLPIYPQREIEFKAWVNFSDSENSNNLTAVYSSIISKNSFNLNDIVLEINFECQQ